MKRVFGALAGVFLTSSAYAADFRTVPEHMTHLGASPEMSAIGREYAPNIRVYDPGMKTHILQRVFMKRPPSDPLADATRTPDMEADEICKVYTTTTPGTALRELERFLQFEIEDKERFSGYELSFWFLFHELEHCGQKGAAHLRLSPERVRLETEADFKAIEKIRRANPNSNIADLVVALRSVRSTYANSFLLERQLRGEALPDTEQALRSYITFVRQIFSMAPNILSQDSSFLREADQEMARGVVILKFMIDPRMVSDAGVRSWAESHLKGFRFFAPKRTAEYEQVAHRMLNGLTASNIARLRPMTP